MTAEPIHADALLEPGMPARFQADGAVVLRGLFADWVEPLRRGVERNMAEPGPYGAENVRPQDGGGRFFDDYCNWQRIPEFADFMRRSPAAAVAGALMGSRAVQVFHDHVLVKEPATPKPTPWHQDIPYYCVDGMQTASFWIPLDPVDEGNTLRLVLGSHLWPKLLRPKKWAGGEDFYANDAEFMDLPDIAAGGYRILAPALQPGDCIVFNYRTVHGAGGNPGGGRRRAFSARFVGDDAHFCERPGRTSPPYPGIGQKAGERLREDWFPTVWQAPA
jgi:ectoine hydroxylase-related dioxygenase (phytanoyl-CoA dioxygenase family)